MGAFCFTRPQVVCLLRYAISYLLAIAKHGVPRHSRGSKFATSKPTICHRLTSQLPHLVVRDKRHLPCKAVAIVLLTCGICFDKVRGYWNCQHSKKHNSPYVEFPQRLVYSWNCICQYLQLHSEVANSDFCNYLNWAFCQQWQKLAFS